MMMIKVWLGDRQLNTKNSLQIEALLMTSFSRHINMVIVIVMIWLQ